MLALVKDGTNLSFHIGNLKIGSITCEATVYLLKSDTFLIMNYKNILYF